MLGWALNLGFAANAADAPVVVTPEATTTAGGKPRKTVIFRGRKYKVTNEEERQLLDSWIDELEEEKRGLEAEVRVEKKKLVKKATSQKAEVSNKVIVSQPRKYPTIAPLLKELQRVERQRLEAIKARKAYEEMMDEEDSIALILRHMM